ncbi:serine hydrolase [Terriglobus saanensis]|nr:serine hydrolase [Terriglobus saanensis]
MRNGSLLIALILVISVLPVSAQVTNDPVLEKQLKDIIAAHHGRVAVFAQQKSTGKTVAMDADLPLQTASTIKLAMLFEATRQVAAGQAKWEEPITLKAVDRVNGSGLLTFMDAPLTLTLKDVATLMVIVSDNTATNLMIDRFTTKAVDEDMMALGLDQTWLYKKSMVPPSGPMPPDQPKYGLGKTTARQIATVIERVGRCQLDVPGKEALPPDSAVAACKIALHMLQSQFYRDGIPRYLETLDSSEAGSGIANKTGGLETTHSDVGIIAGRSGPIILALYTYDNADHAWTSDNEGTVTMAKLSRAIVQAWEAKGIDGKLLVPGLGLDAKIPLPVKP